MAVSLSKGERVSLDKGMTRALVGLGWDTNKYDGGYDFDLDAAAFLLGDNGKVNCDEDFIFYNNLVSRNEVILIDFSKIPSNVSKIAITVTIHDAVNRKQNFGQVSNAYVRLAKRSSENDMAGEDVLRFDLVEDFSIETAIVVCELYRKGSEWKFNAVAAGYQGGLEALCRSFGVNV